MCSISNSSWKKVIKILNIKIPFLKTYNWLLTHVSSVFPLQKLHFKTKQKTSTKNQKASVFFALALTHTAPSLLASRFTWLWSKHQAASLLWTLLQGRLAHTQCQENAVIWTNKTKIAGKEKTNGRPLGPDSFPGFKWGKPVCLPLADVACFSLHILSYKSTYMLAMYR